MSGLDTDTRQRLVARMSHMLEALAEAEKIDTNGFESTSWRGQLSGFSSAVEIIVGPQVTSEILDLVREEAQRNFGGRPGDGLVDRAFARAERKPADTLGYEYVARGEHEKALAEGLRALKRNPDSPRRNAFLIRCYLLLNRLEEARILIAEATRKNIDSPGLHYCSYLLAFLKRDAIEMGRQVAWGLGKPGVEDVMFSLEAGTQAFFGRLSAARDLTQRAVSSAEQLGENELAARYKVCSRDRGTLWECR